jgi:hypothetical protein
MLKAKFLHDITLPKSLEQTFTYILIGLIAICGGSASLAVEFYRHAVNMMMTYWMDALKFDIFTSHTLEIEIARFSEVVFKASEHYLLTD